jgi:pyruvate dehydrogenase E2 component (dihydrolipoamide acetyltransferase)
MSTTAIDFSKYEDKPKIDFSKYETPAPKQADPMDTEGPLTSHWAATEQGLNRIAKGAIHGLQGTANMVMHPIDTAKGFINAPGQFVDQLKQVPGAISDINASPDPMGTYLNAAGQTAGEGAGQALVAIAAGKATEGARNVGGVVIDKAGKLTPKQAAQIIGGTSGAVAGHGPLSPPGAYYGAKTAGRIAEGVLGKERANAPIFGQAPEAAPAPPPQATPAPAPAPAPEPALETSPGFRVPEVKEPIPIRRPLKASDFALKHEPFPGDQAPTQAPPAPASGNVSLPKPASDAIDQLIPPSNKALNMQVKSKVQFYLNKGDLESAQAVIENAAAKVPVRRGTNFIDNNTPAVQAGPPQGTTVPQADMTDILKKSLDRVKASRARGAYAAD